MSGGAALSSRRAALSLLAASAAAPAIAAAPRPRLATPEQVDAERRLLALEADPEVRRLQRTLWAELAASPRAALPEAASTLRNAISQWTRSLLFAELAGVRPQPAILWGTDDTPRTWLGHTLGGVGTSGDNPDAVYRAALIDGGARHELVGQIDPMNPAVQLVIEADRGDLARPAQMMIPNPAHPDLGVQIALLTDRDLAIGADGRFRLTLGPAHGGPQHIRTEPGPVTVGFRDMLSDWRQRPCRLALRRLEPPGPAPAPAELRRRVLDDLADYVRFWARFPDHWMGGLKPNAYAAPSARAGGWGAVSGLRFSLARDEALLVRTVRGGARYTGFQLTDPWMIAPDARRHQASLNLSQATPDREGGFTYVVSPVDPGVANWLDTAGLRDGFGIVRWQAFEGSTDAAALLREFRVTKLVDVAAMDLPRASPAERRRRLAERAWTYASRTR